MSEKSAHCWRCGTPLVSEASFCKRCGAKMKHLVPKKIQQKPTFLTIGEKKIPVERTDKFWRVHGGKGISHSPGFTIEQKVCLLIVIIMFIIIFIVFSGMTT